MSKALDLTTKIENLVLIPNSKDPGGELPDYLRALLNELNLRTNQFALAIGVAPLTVSRWLLGKNCPRPHQAKEIRAFVEKLEHPDEPSGFVGIDWFFERAVSADRIYVLKRSKEFIAGADANTRNRLFELLQAKKDLEAIYIYPKTSVRPRQSIRAIIEMAQAKGLGKRVRQYPLEDFREIASLFWWPNLFVLHYPASVAAKLGRVYDLFEEENISSLKFRVLSEQEVNDYRSDAEPTLLKIAQSSSPALAA